MGRRHMESRGRRAGWRLREAFGGVAAGATLGCASFFPGHARGRSCLSFLPGCPYPSHPQGGCQAKVNNFASLAECQKYSTQWCGAAPAGAPTGAPAATPTEPAAPATRAIGAEVAGAAPTAEAPAAGETVGLPAGNLAPAMEPAAPIHAADSPAVALPTEGARNDGILG